MSTDLIPIATFVTPAQAAAARCALEAQGIVSFLKDDHLAGTLVGNTVGYVKLMVPVADAQRARDLLEHPFDDWPGYKEATDAEMQAFGRQLADGGGNSHQETANPYASPRSMSADESRLPDKTKGQESSAHALCPSCGEPRVAVCPYCQTTGGHFRAAEDFTAEDVSGEAADGEPVMLICPTCDEPFDAAYFRVCGACGHDFGSGLDTPPIVRELSSEPLNGRVIAVAAGCIALVAALIIYFAMILP